MTIILWASFSKTGKGKVKIKWIYIVPSCGTSKVPRHGPHSFT